MYEDFIKGTADMEYRSDEEAHRDARETATTAAGVDHDPDLGLNPTRAAFSQVSECVPWRPPAHREFMFLSFHEESLPPAC